MFRFTIRDVLWLTVVVAMGFGWWMDGQTKKYDMAISWQQEMEHSANRAGYTFTRSNSGLKLIPAGWHCRTGANCKVCHWRAASAALRHGIPHVGGCRRVFGIG